MLFTVVIHSMLANISKHFDTQTILKIGIYFRKKLHGK